MTYFARAPKCGAENAGVSLKKAMTAKLKSNARTLLQGSENSAGNWLHFLKNANHYLASSTPMMTKFAVLLNPLRHSKMETDCPKLYSVHRPHSASVFWFISYFGLINFHEARTNFVV